MLSIKIPRVILCGLRGGSGKTFVSLGLSASFRKRGLDVCPFKKGPDYIDAAWHSLAAGTVCRNLDTFMMGADRALESFLRNSRSGALSLIEGNRGLFDGMDADGAHSSAELAKLLKTPVVLVVDCTKATRTIAATVLGCKAFDPGLDLAGVVLNYVSGSRHERVLREAIGRYTGVPVLGAIPRLADPLIGERHMGLFTPAEHAGPEAAIEAARCAVESHLDIEAVQTIMDAAEPLAAGAGNSGNSGDSILNSAQPTPDFPGAIPELSILSPELPGERPRIGVIRDSAFTFYYPESLEQLRRHGADLVEVDALRDARLPSLDGLYIGGGFPETHAAQLSANAGFRHSLRQAIERGLPLYAECGGLTYLSDAIVVGGKAYPMVGVFPVTFEIASKPQGHGYTIMEVDRPNPFFDVGTIIHGHEFRYSRVLECDSGKLESVYRVRRGKGFDGARDGLMYRNALAAFCHVHPLGLPGWGAAFVARALEFRLALRRREPAETRDVGNVALPAPASPGSRGDLLAQQVELIHEDCLAAD